MRRIRLFVGDEVLAAGQEFTLPEELAHYARNVLRLEQGAELQVFDVDGREFRARVTAVPKRALTLLAEQQIPALPESPLALHLGLGLLRGERMDWAIQKATELGAASITPLGLQRCTLRLDADRAESRLRHWRQVAVSAC